MGNFNNENECNYCKLIYKCKHVGKYDDMCRILLHNNSQIKKLNEMLLELAKAKKLLVK